MYSLIDSPSHGMIVHAMPDNAIMIRIFIEVPDESAALRSRDAVEIILKQFGEISFNKEPERYWKIPTYFELLFNVRPPNVRETFPQILDALGTDWLIHTFDTGGDWAIWNPKPTNSFQLPEARWSHVECFNNQNK